MSVIVVTHLICAAAYGALAVALFARRAQGTVGRILGAACLVTVVWALAASGKGLLPYGLVAVAESARNAVWLLFMCSLVTAGSGERAAPWARTATIWAVALALAAIAIDLVYVVFPTADGTLTHPQILARIGVAVLGLSLVENYYRNTDADRRWFIIPLSIAIGASFAFDLFYYVDAFLSQPDRALGAARPLADALTVPLLVVAMARNANWQTDIRISHKAAFHALTLVSSGIFLVSVALVGALFRRYGGQWGIVLQVTSLFGSAVVLATVMSSETARSGIRIGILRHFFAYRYDYRVEWLRCIDALTAGSADLPERVIRAVADSVNSPGGVLFQRHDHVYVPSAYWNAEVPADVREPADGALVAGFRDGRWIVALRAAADGVEPGQLPAWLGSGNEFWLAVPLPHRREIIGFVVLCLPRAPVNPDWEVYDLLRIVARQAASYFSEQQAQRALADAQMLQEYSKRFAFVIHDIKNLSSQLGLILSNARRHAGNPEFQADVMRTVENSVARMNKLLSQLKSATAAPPVAAVADAHAILRELIAAHPQSDRIDAQCAGSDAVVQMEAEPLRSVLAHLIDNAIEASGTQAPVTVNLGGDDERITIEVADQGSGMEANFVRDELFRPFRSTKDSGFGIGAFQTRELVRAAGGQLDVVSRPGAGTTMRIVLRRASHRVSEVSPAA
ncbi:MAG TPA: XrtA/PEP-CTERM system histidine kinase PrsK [Stellaceae bacterium]|nr:XrtA/PEP-CTERM system histidine kinase PrsK [Stellaceae bacterium]